MFNKLLLLFLFVMPVLYGQETHQIELNIENREKDTNLVHDLVTLGYHYLKTDSTKSINYYKKAYRLSNELNSLRGGEIAMQLGKFFQFYGNTEKAIKYVKESIRFFDIKNDSINEFNALSYLVYVYEQINEPHKAVEELNKALESKIESSYFQFLINNRLGSITKRAGEFDLALEYYNLSDFHKYKIDTTQKEVVMAILSNDKNRGVIYRNQENYIKGEYFLQKSLQKSKAINGKAWVARNYNSLALLYEKQGDLPKSIDYFERSLELKRELNYNSGISTSLTNLGNIYRLQKQYDKAFALLSEADSLSEKGQGLLRASTTKINFSLLYRDLKEFEKAYKYLLEGNVLRDSFHIEEKSNLMHELDAKYKNKAFKTEQEKLKAELESADLREKNKTAQLKEQQNYIIFGSSLGMLLLVLVLAVVRSNMKRKKANLKLNQKNHEITQKNIRIEEQSSQLEIKNKEILDSISYARRIQQAILPPVKLVKAFLNDSFILYLPKDIVAGDFYWMEPLGDKIIFAAADCTGHGVPGAMVSVICNNGLNRSVREYGLTKPSDILDKTREIVIQEFEKSEDDVSDGMDISLVSIHIDDEEKTLIEYAGANNPLWVIRKGNFEESLVSSNKIFKDSTSTYSLLEIKADKQPIGKHMVNSPYTNHTLSLKRGDTVYLFSDGYVDQFGSSSNSKSDKKFKPNNFRDLLFSMQEDDLLRQKSKLLNTFEMWKGDLEQVDDVCVIGVRL